MLGAIHSMPPQMAESYGRIRGCPSCAVIFWITASLNNQNVCAANSQTKLSRSVTFDNSMAALPWACDHKSAALSLRFPYGDVL